MNKGENFQRYKHTELIINCSQALLTQKSPMHKPKSTNRLNVDLPRRSSFNSLRWFLLSCRICFSISLLILFLSLLSSFKQQSIAFDFPQPFATKSRSETVKSKLRDISQRLGRNRATIPFRKAKFLRLNLANRSMSKGVAVLSFLLFNSVQ